MNRKPLALLAAFALLCLASWPLLAQPAGGREGGPGILRPRLLARALDLTEDQASRSRELVKQALAETKPLRSQVRSLGAELHRELDASSPDDARISSLARDLHSLRGELKQKRQGLLEEFEALLTPQQKERFETLRDLRHRLRDTRRGKTPADLGIGP